MLLWTKNWAWTCNSDPSNKISGLKSIMFHSITCNKWTSSTKSSLTMYSNCTFLIFNNIKKLLDDFQRRRSPIRKNQIMMFNSLFRKSTRFISMIIKPNDHSNTKFFKHRHIISRCKYTILYLIKIYSIFINRFIIRWTKSNKLIR